MSAERGNPAINEASSTLSVAPASIASFLRPSFSERPAPLKNANSEPKFHHDRGIYASNRHCEPRRACLTLSPLLTGLGQPEATASFRQLSTRSCRRRSVLVERLGYSIRGFGMIALVSFGKRFFGSLTYVVTFRPPEKRDFADLVRLTEVRENRAVNHDRLFLVGPNTSHCPSNYYPVATFG